MANKEVKFPLNKQQTAELLGVRFYHLEYWARIGRITMPEPICGRRLWFASDLLQTALQSGRLTPEIQAICEKGMANAK